MAKYQRHQRFTEADRDKVAGRLRDAFSDGRLEHEEFSERLDALYKASTYGELEPLVTDLPAIRTYNTPAVVKDTPAVQPGQFAEPPARKKKSNVAAAVFGGFGGIVALNVVIWLVIGIASGMQFPYFWPVWLLIPWAFTAMGAIGGRRGRD